MDTTTRKRIQIAEQHASEAIDNAQDRLETAKRLLSVFIIHAEANVEHESAMRRIEATFADWLYHDEQYYSE